MPLLIAAYIWVLRRRRVAMRYSSLSLVRAALPRYSRWRRHLPFALFLLALTSLIVALAPPGANRERADRPGHDHARLDVSGSMRQSDIQPSRLGRPRRPRCRSSRARRPTPQIGIVAFAGYAELIQPPTSDQEALQAAVESLTTGRGTAIGSGILKAMDAIAEIDQNVAPSVTNDSPREPACARAERRVRARHHRLAHRRRGHDRPCRRWTPRSKPPTAACASTPSASAPRRGLRGAPRGLRRRAALRPGPAVWPRVPPGH